MGLDAMGMARPLQSSLTPELLKAVDHALAGDGKAAHEIVQDHEGDPHANWIHAVVHRMEGDLGNARYWYERSPRPFRPELSTSDELLEIRAALRG